MMFEKEKVKYVCGGVGIVVALIAIAFAVRSLRPAPGTDETLVAEEVEPKRVYGIPCDGFEFEEGEVKNGETLSHILGRYGIGPATIDRIDRVSRPIYDMRGMRAGHKYTAFVRSDSCSSQLAYFVYEKNPTDYVVVSLLEDSVVVTEGRKEVELQRRKATAKIESSLWNCMMANDLPAALSCEMEDIFGWSVDFFGLQKGDEFTVIYDEEFIDTTRVGIGQIWGAVFRHGGKEYFAIPYEQDGRISFWDENGNSLRKQLLKAPLKYSRISSRFSYGRMHPILKIRRPHLGVDYAAPSGTPVVAIADGVVVAKYYDRKGGGNYLKLKHANNLSSAYMHLRGYAKGIAVGSRVAQGQLIGYVGSTGLSTGPHLDFRLYKGGMAIDPLKAPSEPVEPVRQEEMSRFEVARDKVLVELQGDVPEGERLTLLDITAVPATGNGQEAVTEIAENKSDGTPGKEQS